MTIIMNEWQNMCVFRWEFAKRYVSMYFWPMDPTFSLSNINVEGDVIRQKWFWLKSDRCFLYKNQRRAWEYKKTLVRDELV